MTVGMTLDEFWGRPDDIDTGITLREFDYYVEAYSSRMESLQYLAAWHASNIMNVWTKRTIKPDKLLGKQKDIDIDDVMSGSGGSDAASLKETLRKQAEQARGESDLTDRVAGGEFDFLDREEENGSWIGEFVSEIEEVDEG